MVTVSLSFSWSTPYQQYQSNNHIINKPQNTDSQLMSVFIEIGSLHLIHRTQFPVVLQIFSQYSTLQSPQITPRNRENLRWLLLSGIDQKKLMFKVIGRYENREAILAYGELKFSYFRYSSETKTDYKLSLKRENMDGGYLDLTINYSPYLNYVGEIEFIDLPEGSGIDTMSIKSKQSRNFWEISCSSQQQHLQRQNNENAQKLELQIERGGFYEKYLRDLMCCQQNHHKIDKSERIQYY